MARKLYVVYDRVACEAIALTDGDAFRVFVANNNGHALRLFQIVQSKATEFGTEFNLYCVGEFNQDNGRINAIEPTLVELNLGNADEVLDGE